MSGLLDCYEETKLKALVYLDGNRFIFAYSCDDVFLFRVTMFKSQFVPSMLSWPGNINTFDYRFENTSKSKRNNKHKKITIITIVKL